MAALLFVEKQGLEEKLAQDYGVEFQGAITGQMLISKSGFTDTAYFENILSNQQGSLGENVADFALDFYSEFAKSATFFYDRNKLAIVGNSIYDKKFVHTYALQDKSDVLNSNFYILDDRQALMVYMNMTFSNLAGFTVKGNLFSSESNDVDSRFFIGYQIFANSWKNGSLEQTSNGLGLSESKNETKRLKKSHWSHRKSGHQIRQDYLNSDN